MGGSVSRTDRTNQDPSFYQIAKDGYQQLVNAIIRPPRANYEIIHLGPPTFSFCNKRFHRTDLVLTNARGQKLQCSFWEPDEPVSAQIPCVIYMHGNSSARIEAVSVLSCCLSLGASVFAFDFAGSGLSDGEFVSLGYFEKEDLYCVVEYLRKLGTVSTIALWGRSMGAATALMHGHRDPSIAAMILDSSFSDLTRLAEEMVAKGREQGMNIPGPFVFAGIHLIRGTVQRRAGFDIRHIRPIANVQSCFIPALFIAANGDDFIAPHHSQEIYNNYAGDKNLIMVDGDHNSPRSQFMFDSAYLFLQNCLQIPESMLLNIGNFPNDGSPPWLFDGISPFGRPILFDDIEFGMTREQQESIQLSLFQMLGQQTATQNSSINERNSSSDKTNSGNVQAPTTVQIPSEPTPIDYMEWNCPLCTLINPPMTYVCSACHTPRFNHDSNLEEQENDLTKDENRNTESESQGNSK